MAKKKTGNGGAAGRSAGGGRAGAGRTQTADKKTLALKEQERQARGRDGLAGLGLEVGDVVELLGSGQRREEIDIVRGKLSLLSLDGGSSNVVSNGVFWPTYVELQLKLWIAGYRTEYFHFDWRKSIREAGKKLCDYIRSSATARQKVSLVAHRMGGLVGRAASNYWATMRTI